MSALSARAKKDRLLRVFERGGGAGLFTVPFDDLSEDVRKRVWSEAKITKDEIPILAFYEDAGHWLLLTSEHLVAKSPERRLRLHWSEISDATFDPDELQQKGKIAMRRLRIRCADGRAEDCQVESGPPFIALLNVLKAVVRLGPGTTLGSR